MSSGARDPRNALAESERRFRSIFSSAGIGMCTVDRDGRPVESNTCFREMLGYSAAELRALRFADFTHPDDLGGNLELWYELVEGKRGHFRIEKRYLTKTGETVWVSVTASRISDAGDRLCLAVIENVTERKRAEEAVRESGELFRTMADSAPVLIWMSNEEGKPSFFNAGWLEFTGRSLEEELEGGWRGVHPDDVEAAQETFFRALRAREGYETEYRLLRADGEYRWVFDRATPRFHADGAFAAFVGVTVDITERKAAEEAIRDREERYRTLVSNIPGAVYRCAADASWTMEFVSDAIAEITGYPASDFLGNAVRSFESVIHPEDREAVALAVEEGIREGRPFVIEYRILHADGSVRWVYEKGQGIVGRSGETLWLDGAIFDVTDRKRIEQELAAQNEELRALDRMKDEFVALVSHELRTPLTSILGYLELLRDEHELPEEQRHFLGIVERNAERLLRLVGDLLFVAQIEAGKLALELGETDLAALAAECVEAQRPRAEAKGVELALEAESVPALTGDRARLGQLLDNLVSNAIKFTLAEGRVEVRVSSAEGAAVLEVSDSGIGIPVGEQAHLFDRFFRASSATANAVQGTGLGLTISRAIVEGHRGRISFASEEGAGTSFRVELPFDGGRTALTAA